MICRSSAFRVRHGYNGRRGPLLRLMHLPDHNVDVTIPVHCRLPVACEHLPRLVDDMADPWPDGPLSARKPRDITVCSELDDRMSTASVLVDIDNSALNAGLNGPTG